MDLRELRYFRAVAELGSFGKAATHLHVAQPALSRQIRKLEHDLGVELLLRNARGVQLTAAGRVLLNRTVALDRDIEEARRETSLYAQQVVGVIRIGAAFPVAQRMLPRLVADYRETYPAVTIELEESGSGPMVDWLMEDRLDVCLIEPPSHPHTELTCIPLWIESVRLIGPASDKRMADGPMKLAQIAALPLILPARQYSIRRLVDGAFTRAHLTYRPSLEVNGASLIIELVKQGLGYTLMPTSAITPSERSHFKICEIAPSILRSVGIVARTASMTDRAVAAFIEIAQRMAPSAAKSALGVVGTYPASEIDVRGGAIEREAHG